MGKANVGKWLAARVLGRMRENGELDLPPGFTGVRLREAGDAFAHACAIAPKEGAATLVWVSRYDLIEFAVVLEPDEPLQAARRAFLACMHALADALAAHCPPERDVQFVWPDAMLFDGGLIGGGRLGWPASCAEDAVPDWLVFGAILRAADLSHIEPGLMPEATALANEGFELISSEAVIESFARHLMTAIDRWTERGFKAVGAQYLERLPRTLAAERRIFDGNGDLLVTLPAAAKPERFSLVDSLRSVTWYDPVERYPRSSLPPASVARRS